jgi:oxygen-independent coproporphyrinogen-3 oxidase
MAKKKTVMKNLSLYIHIPFCHLSKCKYCDFVSFCDKTNGQKSEYVIALLNEIELRSKTLKSGRQIGTIFFGGGTPSVLDAEQIGSILSKIHECFIVADDAEITVEGNPESLTSEKLLAYKRFGVNRLSIGGQSLNDNVLAKIGRKHNSKTLMSAIELAKQAGFENINVDMMIGLPDQTLKDVCKMAKYLVTADVKHISCYSLILEEHTSLFDDVKSGKITLPSEDLTVKMYDEVYKILDKSGFVRYEVSNFAKTGFECRHNQNYWQLADYLAFGVAGHSFVDGVRFANTENFDEYVTKLSKSNFATVCEEKLTREQKMEENIMLRLRTKEGMNLKIFDEEFDCNFEKEKKNELQFLTSHNLVKIENGSLKVTEKSFYVLNFIIEKLI